MKKSLRFLTMLTFVFLFAGSQIHAQTILCIDRDGSAYSENYTDTWPMIQQALDANGFTYDYIDIFSYDTVIGQDVLDASLYDIVIWFTGETWQDGQTMRDEEEFNLILYQAFGGKLFLNAQDYLWDRYGSYGVFSDTEFPYSQLGIVEVEQDVINIPDSDTARFVGSAGSLADGLEIPVQDIFTSDTDEGLWIDKIVEHNGQDLYACLYPVVEDGPYALQYETEAFRTVFSTVEIAAVTDTALRAVLMGRIIDWLMYGTTGVDDVKHVDQSKLVMRPNPVIDYVNLGTFNPMEEVEIFNNQGQLVYQSDVNSKSIKVDLSHLTAGLYIVKAKTQQGIITEKLIKR
jgi:hypothetical protein